MAKAAVLLFLSFALAARAGSDESSRRKSEEATAVLQAVVGKDRGRVVVEAAVEKSETRTIPAGRIDFVWTKTTESVRSLKAVIFLDQALSEETARRGAEAVAEVLGLDESRGDDLKLVRAPLNELPPAPRDWRAVSGAALAAAALAGAVVLALSLRGAAARVAGAIAQRAATPVSVSVAASPPQPLQVHVPAPPQPAAPPAGPARRIEILPRLGDKERS